MSAPFIFLLCHCHQSGQTHSVEVSDGLKHPECGVLLPGLNLIHVAIIAADFLSHILSRQTLLETQFCNDCSKGSFSCIGFPLTNGTTHSRIVEPLTPFCLSVITVKCLGGRS